MSHYSLYLGNIKKKCPVNIWFALVYKTMTILIPTWVIANTSKVEAKFPDKLLGMIDLKLLKLFLKLFLSILAWLCIIGGWGFGNKRQISGVSPELNLPTALAKPIKTGTIPLHRYNFVELDIVDCSWILIMEFTRYIKHSTWVFKISSLLSSHLAATSLSNVWRQKLNFSAIGIPENKDWSNVKLCTGKI